VTHRRSILAARALVALAGVAAFAAIPACRRGPRPISVSAVQVADGAVAEPLREAGLDAATLEEAARVALAQSGFVLRDGAGAYRARVDVASVRMAAAPLSGGPRVEVAVEIALTPVGAEDPGAAAPRELGAASAPLAGRAPSEAWRAAVATAANEAVRGLALGFAEAGKAVPAVVADLASPDARVRDHAVIALAERRSAEAVPALAERLRDPDPDIVQRAVGALGQIGDPRAVPALIDAAQRGDPPFTALVARVIGDLGGPDAEGYLLTIESGHGDPRVRRAAHDALAAMRARPRAVADGR
jgi:HEAT repeats